MPDGRLSNCWGAITILFNTREHYEYLLANLLHFISSLLEYYESVKLKSNYRDGYYWVRASVRSIHEQMYTFMSENQIRTMLNKMRDNGLILVGNYNDDKFDNTNWYTLTEKAWDMLKTKRW